MRRQEGDRRQYHGKVNFPIIDSDGNEVRYDRRSGRDRRRNEEGRDIAATIMSILN